MNQAGPVDPASEQGHKRGHLTPEAFVPFTRQAACTLAGLEVEHFKSLARREQLAVVGQSGFSRLDVAKLAVQAALLAQIGAAGGLDPKTSAMIAASQADELARELDRSTGPDFWIGYVGQPLARSGPTKFDGGYHVSGDLPWIAARVTGTRGKGEPGAMRLFLVNVTEVLREVRLRAMLANVQFDAEA